MEKSRSRSETKVQTTYFIRQVDAWDRGADVEYPAAKPAPHQCVALSSAGEVIKLFAVTVPQTYERGMEI